MPAISTGKAPSTGSATFSQAYPQGRWRMLRPMSGPRGRRSRSRTKNFTWRRSASETKGRGTASGRRNWAAWSPAAMSTWAGPQHSPPRTPCPAYQDYRKLLRAKSSTPSPLPHPIIGT